jgi:hypothetical protein
MAKFQIRIVNYLIIAHSVQKMHGEFLKTLIPQGVN